MQHPISSLAGLQGLAGLSSAAINSPLNLSVGTPSALSSSIPAVAAAAALSGGSGGGVGGGGGLGGAQMPQLILASGQLVQGVQGAQLLIPTSQGAIITHILRIKNILKIRKILTVRLLL